MVERALMKEYECNTPNNIKPDESKSIDALENNHDGKDDYQQIFNNKKTSALDRLLKQYCHWSNSSLLTDRGLKVFQWTLWLLSYYSNRKKTSRKNIVGPSLRKLYLDVSNTRYMLRLYGFPTALDGIRTGSFSAGKWENPLIYRLGKFMAWNMLFYYPFEHAAFFTWMMPNLLKHRIDAGKASARSCRFWLLFILSDWISAVLKNQELKRCKQKLMLSSKQNNENDKNCDYNELREMDNTIAMNRLQMLRCALFTVPAFQWSLPNWDTDPWLPESIINSMMWGESIVSLYQSIRSLPE